MKLKDKNCGNEIKNKITIFIWTIMTQSQKIQDITAQNIINKLERASGVFPKITLNQAIEHKEQITPLLLTILIKISFIKFYNSQCS